MQSSIESLAGPQSPSRYLVALGALALMPLAVVATFANEMRTSSLTDAMTQREAADLSALF